MASGPITSWQVEGDKVESVKDFIFLGSKIFADSDCSLEIKIHLLLGRKTMTNLARILKNRHHFANKGQSYGFSSNHVWMWGFAGSQHTRSHPWQGREEETWQARPIRASGILKSCPGAHLKDDLCLSDACYTRLLPNFCDMVEGLLRFLSKQNQLKTLISMSAGRWYPIRLSRMKGVFQFRPLCWHSSLLGKCVLMHITAHNTLIINSIKNLITQKALGTEPY